MTRKKFNFIRPKNQVRFEKAKKLYAFIMWCIGSLTFKFFEFLGGVYLFLLLYRLKYDLDDKWILIEELIQEHYTRYPEKGRKFEEDKGELDPAVLYETYKELATALEYAGLAELREVQLTRSQIARWPRILKMLSAYHRTRYTRFLHDKSKDQIRVRMHIVRMPNGSTAQCFEGLEPAIKLTFVRRKQK